jgi:hypothetical protein
MIANCFFGFQHDYLTMEGQAGGGRKACDTAANDDEIRRAGH